MSGGTDISFLRNLRVPCAIVLAIFVTLMVLAVGSCVSCIRNRGRPEPEPSGLSTSLGPAYRSPAAEQPRDVPDRAGTRAREPSGTAVALEA